MLAPGLPPGPRRHRTPPTGPGRAGGHWRPRIGRSPPGVQLTRVVDNPQPELSSDGEFAAGTRASDDVVQGARADLKHLGDSQDKLHGAVCGERHVGSKRLLQQPQDNPVPASLTAARPSVPSRSLLARQRRWIVTKGGLSPRTIPNRLDHLPPCRRRAEVLCMTEGDGSPNPLDKLRRGCDPWSRILGDHAQLRLVNLALQDQGAGSRRRALRSAPRSAEVRSSRHEERPWGRDLLIRLPERHAGCLGHSPACSLSQRRARESSRRTQITTAPVITRDRALQASNLPPATAKAGPETLTRRKVNWSRWCPLIPILG